MFRKETCSSYGTDNRLRTSSRRSLLAALAYPCAVALAKGKKMKHEAGFLFELPDKWKWEDASAGGVLLPPGVAVDPDREDNQEVYSIHAQRGVSSERAYVERIRADLKGAKIEIDRGGDLENFSAPGRPGIVYTFDFAHPKLQTPHRVRIFAMTPKGSLIVLQATGLRQKLEQRDRLLREVARSLDWK